MRMHSRTFEAGPLCGFIGEHSKYISRADCRSTRAAGPLIAEEEGHWDKPSHSARHWRDLGGSADDTHGRLGASEAAGV